MTHLPITPTCNQCHSVCGLSFEFLEAMEKLLIDEGKEDMTEFDEAIEESIAGEHKHEHRIDEEFLPFPISLDTEREGLYIAVWCPRCKKLRDTTISLQWLIEVAQKHKKGGSLEDSDQSPD